MVAEEVARRMGMELLLPSLADKEMTIGGCYLGDLLSSVMGSAAQDELWMTVITNINVVAVAQLLGLSGIVFLEGNRPAADVLDRAKKEEIPVFATEAPAYEAALRFRDMLAAER